MPQGRREQRKAQRQASDVATALIIRRGFEAVSMSEIAEAAGVSRKTVFNYFASKEDLVFDRDEGRRCGAQGGARRGMTPLAAFQSLVRELLDSGHPCCGSMPVQRPSGPPWPTVRCWWARATALADDLTLLMASAVGRPADDAEARLGAAMLLASMVAAYQGGLASQQGSEDPRQAMLQLIVRGVLVPGCVYRPARVHSASGR